MKKLTLIDLSSLMAVTATRRFLLVLMAAVVVAALQLGGVMGNMVLRVENKFRIGGGNKNLTAMKSHDIRRHRRFLSSVDLELGGSGHPAEAGLYFAKIGLGTPPKDYYVQVDTGSDLLWVNCAGCSKCPTKSDLGIKLTLFDPKNSKTSKDVGCSDEFCIDAYHDQLPGCKSGLRCQYNVVYGDGSATTGYFVKDYVELRQVSGDLKTSTMNSTIVFGCGAKQSGDLGSSTDAAVDGILGFGQSNTSMLSQLAAAGKVKREFAHCLDVKHGGGIFTIGNVVSPKVKTTPMVPNMPHYNVVMRGIQVGNDVLELPTDVFDSGIQRGTIIDSGTTLAYLPDVVYQSIMTKIMDRQDGLKLRTVEDQFSCFQYSKNVDKGFPSVTFNFENSLNLVVRPREYLFTISDDVYCFGWMNGGLQARDGKQMILLGDLVLQDKLVVYDIENQTIGWTEYNCSSSIKVKDKESGQEYEVGPHDISSAMSMMFGSVLTFVSVLVALLQVIN